jgi:hypothetical protein
MTLDTLRAAIDAAGLVLRGAFHPETDDKVPAMPSGDAVATLVLVGFAGSQGWGSFARSPEFGDRTGNPLDRWSRRVVGTLASKLGGTAFYPFVGPPFLPFMAWAQRAEPVAPSPIGMLIHPDWGLWHSYRGALGLATRLGLPPPDRRISPCVGCSARPCLTSCPVGALTPGRYDSINCAAHLAAAAGTGCLGAGCLARRACPVGRRAQYEPAQAAFHMQAFLGAQRE